MIYYMPFKHYAQIDSAGGVPIPIQKSSLIGIQHFSLGGFRSSSNTLASLSPNLIEVIQFT